MMIQKISHPKWTVASLALAIVVGLSGCAGTFNTADNDSFSCPGMPQGIICKTPSAVYKSTNQMPAQQESDIPFVKSSKGAASDGGGWHTKLKSSDNATEPTMAVLHAADTGSTVSSLYAKPVRAPAQVMRIWIAPWIDSNDDLHYPSYLFTEVQQRRWSIGNSEFDGVGVIVPHRDEDVTASVPNGKDAAPKQGQPAAKSGGKGVPQFGQEATAPAATGQTAVSQQGSAGGGDAEQPATDASDSADGGAAPGDVNLPD